MLAFFDINTIAFVLMGYPMSWIELLGMIFNLLSVWLAVRNKIATWWVGIIGIVLFFGLFYQIRLYSDTLEQVYYLAAGFYGWAQWAKRDRGGRQAALPIRHCCPKETILTLVITAALSVAAGALMSRIHLLWPAFFPQAAAYPYIDALTTIMSFSATLLLARRRIECWYYWIAVDAIGVVLYGVKGVLLVALLYGVYLLLCLDGLVNWRREQKNNVEKCW